MWVLVNYRSGSHLSKITHIKQVKGLEQFALLHAEDLGAGIEKRPDVLQTEELQEDKIKHWFDQLCPWNYKLQYNRAKKTSLIQRV